MINLVIGKDGYLGGMLSTTLRCTGTSRHPGAKPYFNLKTTDPNTLPNAEVVYIIAAITKFRECEIDPDAWAINVDGPIRLGNRYKDSFIVYMSSEAAEWPGHTAYGDQKRFAEMGLLSVVPYKHLAIVRPDRVTPDKVDRLCKLLEQIGREKKYGVHRFR
jgi:dTDP-4-dehydrorhamnose reductase